MDKLLGDCLAPGLQCPLAKATPEALNTGKANAVDLTGVSSEHDDSRVTEDLPHLLVLSGLVVMVAKHSQGRYFRISDTRLRQPLGLVGLAIISEIATQQQHIRLLGRLCQQSLQYFLGDLGIVEISEGRDTYDLLWGRHSAHSSSEIAAVQCAISAAVIRPVGLSRASRYPQHSISMRYCALESSVP